MASFFQSFRSSSMPKRLLRYALARLDLLDTDALDLDNLDLALGRNTIFEFRDVGLRLDKLEKLLQLPAAIHISRAKVLLLRVTIPMDFYTSPISVEVDGVDVRLKSDVAEPDDPNPSTPPASDPVAEVVPDAADLAQSFLETQPSQERKRLEDALVAETHDLGASVAASDDGSEGCEETLGTGQALSLPVFLADFLKGILDRIQIRIMCITFQLDMKLPAAGSSPQPTLLEPVSFQLAVESIEVEGITAPLPAPLGAPGTQEAPTLRFMSKPGKRHVSLANVRARLISEANFLSALSRSSSVAPPSAASSSPLGARNPPARRSSSPSPQRNLQEQLMSPSQEGLWDFSAEGLPFAETEEQPRPDSEEALNIPYQLDQDSPPTPRPSTHSHTDDFGAEGPSFLPEFEEPLAATHQSSQAPAFDSDEEPRLLRPEWMQAHHETSDDSQSSSAASSDHSTPGEDLAESHLYTHEEAESMYQSAFSSAEPTTPVGPPRLAPSRETAREETNATAGAARNPVSAMPGAWADDSYMYTSSVHHLGQSLGDGAAAQSMTQGEGSILPGLSASSASRSRTRLPFSEANAHRRPIDPDDLPTPRGPSRVVKDIMRLDRVSIYLPSQHGHLQARPEATSPPNNDPAPGRDMPQPSGSLPRGHHASDAADEGTIDVELSPLSVCLDTSLAILIAMAFGEMLKITKDRGTVSEDQRRRSQATSSSISTPAFKLVADKISLSLLHQLNGVAEYPGHLASPLALEPAPENTVLNATLQDLFIAVSTTQDQSLKAGAKATGQETLNADMKIGRFRLGYADGDIISFDGTKPMTTSVRDAFLRGGNDIAIKLVHSEEVNQIDLEALPLVLQLDLQRLDETIGCFGGLSSFLNASMSSGTSSPKWAPLQYGKAVKMGSDKQSSTSAAAGRKTRPGVRFEVPSAENRIVNNIDQSLSLTRNKINLRAGGAHVELVGRECSLAAEMSTVKVVGRDQGIGVVCAHLRFTGPHLKQDHSPRDGRSSIYAGHGHHRNMPPLTTELCGLRLELSPTPGDRDLEKLLQLIIPSKVKFDEDGEGEIMVETLLRQRRKGSVLRVTVETIKVRVENPAQLLPALPNLIDEVARLSTTVAAKYLPEDDRPGLFSLIKLENLDVNVNTGSRLGLLEGKLKDFEVAHITLPSLVAVALQDILIRRNGSEVLVSSEPLPQAQPLTEEERGPVVMVRAIGDEMEPTIKMKLRELRVEYHVPVVMDALGLDMAFATPQEFEASLAASVVNLADRAPHSLHSLHTSRGREGSIAEEKQRRAVEKSVIVDVGLRDCLVGLNPLNLPSKLVVALTDARLQTALTSSDGATAATVRINKASLLLIDDVAVADRAATAIKSRSGLPHRRRSSTSSSFHVTSLCASGFVDICYISSASAKITASAQRRDDGTLLDDGGKQVVVELRDDLLVLETCADSTHTLIALFNALKPPTPPAREDKFRTKVVPVQDLLASISAEAFGKPEGDYDFDYDFAGAQELAGSVSEAEHGSGQEGALPREDSIFDSQVHGEELFDAMAADENLMDDASMQDTTEGVLLTKGLNVIGSSRAEAEPHNEDSSQELVVHDDFYGNDDDDHNGGGEDKSQTAKLWNSAKNTYEVAPESLIRASPLKMSVRDVHVIWNLFDGYDWVHTRDVITKAVEEIEFKAMEFQHQPNRSSHPPKQGSAVGGHEPFEDQEEEDETIGDFLFNSIYIGVSLNRDPRDLSRAINQGLGDDGTATETGSVATTTTSSRAAQMQASQGRSRRHRRLRLHRSQHRKITFELKGVCADVIVYPPQEKEEAAAASAAAAATRTGKMSRGGGQETLSSIDVRVHDLDIFDHVPTSTWRMFATYDQDQGEREMGTDMVHLEVVNVKPIPDLAPSEIVLRAKVLPLRLYVDQDALDFITRFFEFKDDRTTADEQSSAASASNKAGATSDIPFLQRAEVLDIPIKLDFKPKRVDYAGLRSGHTSEFMNFIVLDEARMVLRHVIVYGVSGFDRLGKTLNDIWTPDVRTNQLPGVVAGLAPVRSLVNIGSGFRDLVEIPLKEYRKDGRVVRSISKGAATFARTTGTELVKLGAKLAVGTQYALQEAEGMLSKNKDERALWQQHHEYAWKRSSQVSRDADDGGGGGGDDNDEDIFGEEDLDGLDEEDKKQVSLYADQPTGVLQGIRGGYRSLVRDVNVARDAIIAVPGEVLESQSAAGAARAVLRRAPTIIFRPAVGMSKAIGQTLLGATNTMDQQNRRRVNEKYKH